jgi:hypothetical protein
MSTVKVTGASNANPTQIVGTSTNNPEYGYIRVESATVQMNNGWLNSVTRSALIKGKTSDLKKFAENLSIGTELPGKIVVKESLTPFYEGQQPKRNGNAADSVVLFKRVDGVEKPIYRETVYTMDMTVQDDPIQHDNVLSTTARQVTANTDALKIN